MIKYPECDKVGLFRKLRSPSWLVNHYGNGKPYMKGNIILYATTIQPIYSYGNNYKKFGIEFSLFVWTNESDIAKVSSRFDRIVKSLTRDEINKINDPNKTERFVYVGKKV